MATYIKLATGLVQLDSPITQESIANALGYIPSNFSGDYNDLSNKPIEGDILTSNESTFYIVDDKDNIIALVDSSGIHSIDVNVSGVSVKGKLDSLDSVISDNINQLIQHKSNTSMHITQEERERWNQNQLESNDSDLYITDDQGNILALFNINGLTVTEIKTKLVNGVKIEDLVTGVYVDSQIETVEGKIEEINNSIQSIKSDVSEIQLKTDNIEASEEDSIFTIVDNESNTILQVDQNGLITTTITIDDIHASTINNIVIEDFATISYVDSQVNDIVDNHISNTQLHVTQELQDKWNSVADSIETSNTDSSFIITDDKSNSIAQFDSDGLTITSIKTNNVSTSTINSQPVEDFASKNYVDTEIAALVDGAPETLNTLKELGQALSDHEDEYDALLQVVGNKADKNDLTTHTTNTSIHVTPEDKTRWNTVTNKTNQSDFENHTSDTNLHVTKELQNKWNTTSENTSGVENTGSIFQIMDESGNNTIFQVDNESAKAIDFITEKGSLNETISFLKIHEENLANPHAVTKEQIGLGNVDNTSDLNKPISNAMQNALNSKANANDLTTHTNNTTIHVTSGDKQKWNEKQDKLTFTGDIQVNGNEISITLPTKISDLTNDRGYITSIPSEYLTEGELAEKGYITSDDLPTVDTALNTNSTNAIANGVVTEAINSLDNNKQDKLTAGSNITIDNTNKISATVPTKTSDLTNDSGYITSIPSEYVTDTELTNKGYITANDLPVVDTTLNSTSENAISNKAVKAALDDKQKKLIAGDNITILDNGTISANITAEDVGIQVDKALDSNSENPIANKVVAGAISSIESNYIQKEDGKGLSSNDFTTPLKTKLEGLSNYELPDDVVQDANYVHTDNNYTAADKALVAQISGKQDIITWGTNISQGSDGKINVTVPTKTSDLINDSGYIASIPSEYITETELTNKGYITDAALNGLVHEDSLSLYATTSYVDGKTKDFLKESDLTTIKNDITTLQSSKLDSSVITNYYTKAETNAAISDALSSLEGEGDVNANQVLVALNTYKASNDGEVAAIKANITNLENDKADKSTTYTKTETDNKFLTQTAAQESYVAKAEMPTEWDADKVGFSADLTFTKQFGRYVPGESGSVTIPTLTNKMTLQGLLEDAFREELNPITTQPTFTLVSSNIGEKEVGTKISIAYQIKDTTTGSYTYGPDTGVTWSNYSATFNGQTKEGMSGTFNEVQVADNTNLSISGSAKHSAGITPKTNLGNDFIPETITETSGAIQEKTITKTKGTLSGYRKMFWGTMTSKPETMTSSNIRALNGVSEKAGTCTDKSLTIPLNCYRVVIAVPSNRTLSKVLDVNDSNANIVGSFKSTTVNVEGANNYTAQTYNVYYLDYANANDTVNTYKVTIK